MRIEDCKIGMRVKTRCGNVGTVILLENGERVRIIMRRSGIKTTALVMNLTEDRDPITPTKSLT
jgi:hypothetical protein